MGHDPGLPDRGLGGRRIGLLLEGIGGVGIVPQHPDMVHHLGLKGRADHDPPLGILFQGEFPDQGIGLDPGRPDQGRGEEVGSGGQPDRLSVPGVEPGRQKDLDSDRFEAADRLLRQLLRQGREDPAGRLDQDHPDLVF